MWSSIPWDLLCRAVSLIYLLQVVIYKILACLLWFSAVPCGVACPYIRRIKSCAINCDLAVWFSQTSKMQCNVSQRCPCPDPWNLWPLCNRENWPYWDPKWGPSKHRILDLEGDVGGPCRTQPLSPALQGVKGCDLGTQAASKKLDRSRTHF